MADDAGLAAELRDLREIVLKQALGEVTNAAAIVVIEETVRAILDAMPAIDGQAVRARVSERLGAGLVAPVAAALDRMFAPSSSMPRH